MYNSYSQYLKKQYGEKVYNFRLISRLPVQTAKMEIVDVLFVQAAEPVLRQWSKQFL